MENTKPKHKLYDHPYLGAFVAILLVLAATNVAAVFPAMYQRLYTEFIAKGDVSSAFLTTMKIITEAVSLLVALIALLVHKHWFRKDGYKGCFTRPMYQNKDVLIILIAAIVLDVVLIVGSGLKLAAPTAVTLAIAINAGVSEEVTLRAIPVSIILKNNPSYKRMWSAAIVTSAAFGLIHFTNIGAGAPVFATVLQAISALCSGMFLAAIYIRTGNILFTMVYHALHDIIGLMDPAQATGVITHTSYGVLDIAVMMGTGVVLAAAAIYMLRKSKWDEIKATWANIWAE